MKRKNKQWKINFLTSVFFTLIISLSLIIPSDPIAASAAENPSPEDISRIFDRVAQEKQVPAEILKAIAYVESGWRQWDNNGNVVTGYWGNRPSLGIMQVSAYNSRDTETLTKLKNDIAYNIAYGADVLISKWKMTPRIGDGDRSKLENWYFAIWAYNSWSLVNNPNNANAAGKAAYQDRVLKLMASSYYPGLTRPVTVTPVPKTSIPAGVLPSRNTAWKTPQPVHQALFNLVVASELSRGEEAGLLASVTRISGADRIDTAVKIAYEGWPHGAETVILASSEDYPDALAGVALAAKYKAPILLMPPDELDQDVIDALTGLHPSKVFILGGSAAISGYAESQLRTALTWTWDIERLAGADRFSTAAQIAGDISADKGVAIAACDNFADALSLASAAAVKGYPLLLVGCDSLPEETASFLQTWKPGSMYIAGGTGAISQKVQDRIKEVTGLTDEQITRFAGKDRYETSSLILQSFYPESIKVYLATGQKYPDALAGAALAASSNTPLLLVPPLGLTVDCSTVKLVKSLPKTVEFDVFGGKEVIPDNIIVSLKYLAGTASA